MMQTALQVLDREYLEARCSLLELAATLDRIDRASDEEESNDFNDSRLDLLNQAIALLTEKSHLPNRSERMLLLFSDLD
ncbi:hypothetical protein [Gimesia fumaroli]|jgi:hypothetical protein|uniref:Uncharacterized protein n=1 Tax=Gimesia fumaroli TaxID=2527976 RepID=A0A518IFM0_9PLAN|nr:hypothetical protein [Gimesia fumaroli]QDV51889.1 hypothetical protein Enr17x_39480 [Gimesia fumaroli]